MLESLESLGGNVQCASSRESIMYQSAVFNKDVPAMLEILAETVRSPLITDEEVEQQQNTAAYEVGEIWSKPELILPEMLHTAAFQNNTLGNPLLCPEERLDFVTREVIEEYRSYFYRPERFVVAFAGVEHDVAVKLVEKHFGDMPASLKAPVAETAPGILSRIPFLGAGPKGVEPPFNEPAHYTGGTAGGGCARSTAAW